MLTTIGHVSMWMELPSNIVLPGCAKKQQQATLAVSLANGLLPQSVKVEGYDLFQLQGVPAMTLVCCAIGFYRPQVLPEDVEQRNYLLQGQLMFGSLREILYLPQAPVFTAPRPREEVETSINRWKMWTRVNWGCEAVVPEINGGEYRGGAIE